MSFKKKLKKGGKKALETAAVVTLAPVVIVCAAIKCRED